MIRHLPLAGSLALTCLLAACSPSTTDAPAPAPDTGADETPRALTPQQLLEDIALAREALERIHPGYDRYATPEALNGRWQQLEQRAREGLTQAQFYLELAGVLATIRCDHTKAELTKAMEAERDRVAVYLPFTFRLFEDSSGRVRMYVGRSADDQLERGDEIVSLDGDASVTC
ncbi:MAG: hypothetical protein AAFX85_16810 [Pseudomonadota bacterium]